MKVNVSRIGKVSAFLIIVAASAVIFSTPLSAYSNNMNASVVIGQSSFTSTEVGATATNFGGVVRGIYVDSQGRLIVSDNINNRVLIWNNVPKTNGVAANLVLGQPEFTTNTPNNGGRTAQAIAAPFGVYSDGTRLFVHDRGNGRVLIWTEFPTQNQEAADVVVGQLDMTSVPGTGCSGHTCLNAGGQGQGLWVAEGKLIVGDNGSNRVYIWNTIPTTNGVDADVILGQTCLTCSGGTNPPTQTSLNSPRGLMVDSNGKLFIVDGTSANRVLIWNSIPTTNNASADVVVGQPNFTSNATPVTAAGLNIPIMAFSNGTKLFVSDNNNNRVLIWNSTPTTNGINADIVLGQPSFDSAVSQYGGRSASSFSNSQSVFEYQDKLLVADYGAGGPRILIFDNSPPTGSIEISDTSPTMTSSITLNLTAVDDIELSATLQMKISQVSDFTGANWETYATNKIFELIGSDGSKTVYAKFRDSIGNESAIYTDTITLDTEKPTGSIAFDAGVAATSDRDIVLYVTATDSTSDVIEMKISEDENFTGAVWEEYTEEIFFELSNGDGTKTVYAKFKDSAGNISEVYSDSIGLDTIFPRSVHITDIGLIPNVQNMSSLFYYFTSQAVRIKGTSEPFSLISFESSVDGHIYQTVTNSLGVFSIIIKNPVLPRGYVILRYCSQDLVGHKSAVRTLELVIGEENFPIEVIEEESTEETLELIPTPEMTPTVTAEPTEVLLYTPTAVATDASVEMNDEKNIFDRLIQFIVNLWRGFVGIFRK